MFLMIKEKCCFGPNPDISVPDETLDSGRHLLSIVALVAAMLQT